MYQRCQPCFLGNLSGAYPEKNQTESQMLVGVCPRAVSPQCWNISYNGKREDLPESIGLSFDEFCCGFNMNGSYPAAAAAAERPHTVCRDGTELSSDASPRYTIRRVEHCVHNVSAMAKGESIFHLCCFFLAIDSDEMLFLDWDTTGRGPAVDCIYRNGQIPPVRNVKPTWKCLKTCIPWNASKATATNCSVDGWEGQIFDELHLKNRNDVSICFGWQHFIARF